jgi:hypothetical protein
LVSINYCFASSPPQYAIPFAPNGNFLLNGLLRPST